MFSLAITGVVGKPTNLNITMPEDREVLPKAFKPTNYNLSLYDIDLEKKTYNGTVVIDYDVQEADNAIYLNYRGGVKVSGAELEGAKAVNISYDEPSETVKIALDQSLNPGKAQVTVKFQANIETNMAGFYASRYGDGKEMYSTQFESTDARRAFPCADEPNQKASFEFQLEKPKEDFVVLSNMPVKEEKKGSNNKTVVVFDKSPVMSTYLYAWAMGDFEYIEGETERSYNGKKLPVRVYTTKGLKEQGRLALESAVKIIDFYSKVFGIDYVLPKCDLIAVHEFTHGAMENWGLITYRTTAVLYDPETSDSAYKTRVVYVVAHELAHQWFGNLVTMDWWDELWLNEGFATWVGWFAVDHLYPEWDVFSRFVSESAQQALSLDSLRGSHPIEVAVKSGAEIDQIFDSISYLKGASSIRMLSSQLGEDVFLKGVSNYLKKHSFGNAKTTDLWNALADASGKDVAQNMLNWTQKIGFPVLTVDESGDQITVRQDRFLSTGDVAAEENSTEWWVPLAVSTGLKSEPINDVLHARQGVLSNVSKESFYKLNKDQIGLYRVNYPTDRLDKLSGKINELSNKDRVGLIADSASTASAGIGHTEGFLTLLKTFGESNETDYFVWSEMISRLGNLRYAYSEYPNEKVRCALDQVGMDLITPQLKQMSWDTPSDADFLWIQLRKSIFFNGISLGNNDLIQEAQKRFKSYINGNASAVHPTLRSAVYLAVMKYSSGEDLETAYKYLINELTNSKAVDGRELAISSLGRATDQTIITKNLNMFLNGDIAVQDIHSLVSTLSANKESRQQTWEFIKSNWDAIYSRYGSNMIIFERLMRLVLSNLTTEAAYNDINNFFKDKDLKGYDRAVAQALDVIKVRYQWVARDSDKVESWLKEKKYL